MKFNLSLLILPAVVLASACVIPGVPGFPGAPAVGGVNILKFEFSPPKLFSGETALLFLELQNNGGVDARNVQIFLYGLSSDWNPPKTSETIPLIFAPQPQAGLEGGKDLRTWQLTAPRITQKSFNFAAGVRVCYPYKTVAKTKVDILSEEEYTSRLRQGTLQEKSLPVQETAAPISVALETKPFRVRQDTVNLKLTFSNKGGGTVTTLPCSTFETGLTPDEATLTRLNAIKLGGTACSWPAVELRLEKGQSKTLTVSCKLEGGVIAVPIEAREIEFEANYQYYIDKQASVIVESLEGVAPAAPGVPVTPTAPPPTAPAPPTQKIGTEGGSCTEKFSYACTSDKKFFLQCSSDLKWVSQGECAKLNPNWECNPEKGTCDIKTTAAPTPAPTGTCPANKLECRNDNLWVCRAEGGVGVEWVMVTDCVKQGKKCDPATFICK